MTTSNIIDIVNTPILSIDKGVYIRDLIATPQPGIARAKRFGEFGLDKEPPLREKRLYELIEELALFATNEHIAHNCDDNQYLLSKKENHITRLITSEFLFYTKTPLTLAEFESLQKKVRHLASEQPKNLHLVLCSFAVQTPDNHIANVSIYVTCGYEPVLDIFAKQERSSIDPVYSITDKQGDLVKLAHDNHYFPNSPIMTCQSSGGAKWNTCIDMCLDHKIKPAANKLLEKTEQLDQINVLCPIQFSQIISSNSIDIHPDNCIGNSVTHADPAYRKKVGCTDLRFEDLSVVPPTFGVPINLLLTEPTKCDLLPSLASLLVEEHSMKLLNNNMVPGDRALSHIIQSLIELQNQTEYSLSEKRNAALKIVYQSLRNLHTTQQCKFLFNQLCILLNEPDFYLKQTKPINEDYCEQFEHMYFHILARAKYLYREQNKNDIFYFEKLIYNGSQLNPPIEEAKQRLQSNLLIEDDISVGNIESLEKNLKNGADPNALLSTNDTALNYAISQLQYDMIELLIKYGADLNKKSNDNLPIELAYFLPSYIKNTLIKLLILSGAKLKSAKINHKSLIDDAIENQDASLLKVLVRFTDLPLPKLLSIQRIENANKLLSAVNNGDVIMIKKLLTKGVDPNISYKKIIPCIAAVEAKNIEIVSLLLLYGANPNEKSHHGVSALSFAVHNNDLAITKLLLEAGAIDNLEDSIQYATNKDFKEMITLLNQYKLKNAIGENDHQTIEKLLNEGISPNFNYDQNWTPLMFAITRQNTLIAQLLLQFDANVNAQNGHGMTPLMLAAVYDNASLVKLLLDKSDLSLQTSAGETIFDYASPEIIALLKSKPIDQNPNERKNKFKK